MFVDIGNDWCNSLPKITKHLTKTSIDISLDQHRAKPIIISITERYWYFYSARVIVFGMYRLSLFAALYRCLPECLKRVMFTQMFEEEDVYL